MPTVMSQVDAWRGTTTLIHPCLPLRHKYHKGPIIFVLSWLGRNDTEDKSSLWLTSIETTELWTGIQSYVFIFVLITDTAKGSLVSSFCFLCRCWTDSTLAWYKRPLGSNPLRVGVAPNNLPRNDHSVSTMVGGQHVSPGRAQGFASGDSKPCIFWHHTHLSLSNINSACIQLWRHGFWEITKQGPVVRLDWAERQTKNMGAPFFEWVGSFDVRVCTCTMMAWLLVGSR